MAGTCLPVDRMYKGGGGGRFCTGIISQGRISRRGEFATLGDPQAPNTPNFHRGKFCHPPERRNFPMKPPPPPRTPQPRQE